MAYDPATGDMVLFGGYSVTGVLDDTWTWYGTTWTEVSDDRSCRPLRRHHGIRPWHR